MPAKKNPKHNKTAAAVKETPPRRREIGAIVCLFLAVFSFLGFFTAEGWFIDFFRVFMRGTIGGGFYISVPVLLLCSFILAFHRGRPVRLRVICALLIPFILGAVLHLLINTVNYEWSVTSLAQLYNDGLSAGSRQSGGIIGGLIAILLRALFGTAGAAIVFFAGIIFLALIACNITLTTIVDRFKNRTRRVYDSTPSTVQAPEPRIPKQSRTKRDNKLFDAQKSTDPVTAESRNPLNRAIDIPVDDPPKLPQDKPSFFDAVPKVKSPDQFYDADTEPLVQPKPETDASDYSTPPSGITEKAESPSVPESEKVSSKATKAAKAETEKTMAAVVVDIERIMNSDIEQAIYVYPPIELLSPPKSGKVDGREEVATNAQRLSATIKSFGINAEITNFTRGPSVTRFELELEKGVKLNKLTNLADDIALSLGATGVRIAPIPDKISIVGIEVPNKLVNLVSLRELIESAQFMNNPSKIAFSVGKDIGGNAIIGDISKLPHLLIAGTTGSGKSVCMNSLILSLLYKASPEDVRLIMIDPKMIELGIYNGIPHLLIPVVTDPKKAAGALQWAVVEMMRRYKRFSEVGARDLATYNSAMDAAGEQRLPQIVVLIDELADLMLVAAKDVEESICRVAQMGRASGMHLIIATQRPSADVITGLMKANIPSRIAFAVDSSLNSRIILDSTGAEKLVGKGDMLYAPIGSGKPMRVQGAFVTDKEREDVIVFVKERGVAQYSDEIIGEINKAAEDSKGNHAAKPIPVAVTAPPVIEHSESQDNSADYDELFPNAVDIILESGQASVSMLQRRLKLGYSRAARLVDQMEEAGIVGASEGSKPRQLLLTREQWNDMKQKSYNKH